MNYRRIINIIGKIVCVEAVFMLPALIISLCCGEHHTAFAFAVSAAVTFLLGGAGALVKPAKKNMYAREGFVAVGLGWIAVSLLGALPFLISGAIPGFIDCVFESVSGFTTTGATVLEDVEALPCGLLYWRSFSQWLGGMGVLVFVLSLSTLTAKDSGEAMYLFRAEASGISASKLVPRMRRSAGILYAIYIALTVLQIVLLLLGSVPLFDSVTIAFSTAGTGGFAIKSGSLTAYSAYVQWVVAVFMVLFGVNFNVFYLLLAREAKKAFRSQELRVYLAIIVASAAIITINISGLYENLGEAVRAAVFQVTSVISTSCFVTADFDLWPQLSRTILLALMIVGSCAGSTGGGVKVIRVIIMFKSAARSINKALHPNAVSLIHVDGSVLDDEKAYSVNSYMTLYFIILAATTLLVSVDGQSFETGFTSALACLNNIGVGLGGVGPTCNFGMYSGFSKLILAFSMLIGRLEIYPILILFTPSVWRK